MSEKQIVSIITPCYNGEKTLARLLDSVLEQTYDNIEYILINDGSTDNTEQIAQAYEPAFAERGYRYVYHYQENKGLSGAIDAGLKLFTGEFLCWTDADDYLESISVEERIKVLQKYPECGVVTSNAFIRDGSNLDECKKMIEYSRFENVPQEQFKEMLNGDSIFCCGCHMARTSMFLDVNPDRSIFTGVRRGQNWQMLLPLYYKYKWIFLDKPLYNNIVYKDSMSHGDNTLEKSVIRIKEHETIITETLTKIEAIQCVDLSEEKLHIKQKYAKERMATALWYFDYELYDRECGQYEALTGKRPELKTRIRRALTPLNEAYVRNKKRG